MLDQAAERAQSNYRVYHRFKPGTKVRAIFSEDDQWYDATLGDEVAEGVFSVTYDNYGNFEERPIGFIELKDAGSRRRSDSEERKGGYVQRVWWWLLPLVSRAQCVVSQFI